LSYVKGGKQKKKEEGKNAKIPQEKDTQHPLTTKHQQKEPNTPPLPHHQKKTGGSTGTEKPPLLPISPEENLNPQKGKRKNTKKSAIPGYHLSKEKRMTRSAPLRQRGEGIFSGRPLF